MVKLVFEKKSNVWFHLLDTILLSLSKKYATLKTSWSQKLLPTICTPVGTPVLEKPDGTDITGSLDKALNGTVKHQPKTGLTNFPFIKNLITD